MKMTREQWLLSMTKELNKKVFKPAGYNINMKTVRVSCGYPPQGGLGHGSKTIGVCFPDAINGYNEIFIHPELSKSERVADVLAHELIHHILNCEHGHKKPFRDIAVAIGLEGKMTATVAGKELLKTIKSLIKKIGKYPHKTLNYSGKKQGTRLMKVYCRECEERGINYIIRMSQSTIDHYGKPCCTICGSDMVQE